MSYAQALAAAADAAFRAGPAVESRHVLAGRVLALRFAGPALAAKLLPAFAHLPASSAEPDLTIRAWDDAATGLATPEPQTARTGLEYTETNSRLAFETADRSLQFYDPEARQACFRAPDAATLPAWEQGAPFRRILHWWAMRQGMLLAHAAAIGTSKGAMLLVGASGSGKSTTALACAAAGLSYLSDDYCLLEPGAQPFVHAVYASGKADARAIARLPALAEAFRASPIDAQGKSIIFLNQHAPAAMRRSLKLRAIAVPKIVTGIICRAELLPRAEALRALAPSTLFQMPGDRAESLARMTALIRALPCYQLLIGHRPAAAAPVLESLILRTARP